MGKAVLDHVERVRIQGRPQLRRGAADHLPEEAVPVLDRLLEGAVERHRDPSACTADCPTRCKVDTSVAPRSSASSRSSDIGSLAPPTLTARTNTTRSAVMRSVCPRSCPSNRGHRLRWSCVTDPAPHGQTIRRGSRGGSRGRRLHRAADSAQAVAPAAHAFGTHLQKRITVEAMMGHLHKLQDIANANGNTRAIGTPGYQASVEYVSKALRDKGFDVQTPEFKVRAVRRRAGHRHAGPDAFKATGLMYSMGTPPDGVSGPLVAAPAGDDSPGCTARTTTACPQGAVVLVDRGECEFAEKLKVAVSRAPPR